MYHVFIIDFMLNNTFPPKKLAFIAYVQAKAQRMYLFVTNSTLKWHTLLPIIIYNVPISHVKPHLPM